MDELFKKSFNQFLENEIDLINSDVSERCLCARLAIPMEALAIESGYERYRADIEYNRNFDGEIKTIIDDDYKIVNVTCDLILHSRGENIEKDNLIAVEMKKEYRSDEHKDRDRERLRALTKPTYDENIWSNDGTTLPEHVCGYQLGVFIDINLKNRVFNIEYYKQGQLSSSEELEF